jgi:hypothetical protein
MLFADMMMRCSWVENAIPVIVTTVKSSDARNPYKRTVFSETGDRSNVPTMLSPLRTALKNNFDSALMPGYMWYTGGRTHRIPDGEKALTGRDSIDEDENTSLSEDRMHKKSELSGSGPNFRGPYTKMTSPPSGRMMIVAGSVDKSPIDSAQQE